MKHIIALLFIGLGLSAQAQYWTTNATVTTNIVSAPVEISPGQFQQQNITVLTTNLIVNPILVTNSVKCILTAQDDANLRELQATLKDDGIVTGTFNAWFDAIAAQAVSQAMTSKSGELSATKEARLLRLWNKANPAQQTNAITTLK